MRYGMRHIAVVVLLIGTQGIWGTTEAQGSGLFDWMSRCGQPAEPQIVCYPVTTVTECCEPTVCCQSPDPCCPPVAVYPSRPSFWQRLGLGCGSSGTSASYGTQWTKVPVTSYRPAMSTDPVTGCPVTVLKPCTTYEWQPQRQRLGLFDRLCGRVDPPVTAVECCVPTVCCGPSGYVVSGGTDCGCSETLVPSASPTPATPAPTPAPYYAPSTPGTPSVLTTPPSGFPPAPTLAPSGTAPAAGGAMQPSTQPPPAADVRPALKPADVAPEGSTTQRLPEGGLPWNAAPARPAESGLQDLQPAPTLEPPVVSPENSRLQPVPAPEATPVTPTEQPAAPPLLHPRDQVASLRTGQPWTVTTVTWPTGQRTVREQPPVTPPRRDRRQWDESGWQSVGK